MDLSHKTIIITGGAGGLATALINQLVPLGATIFAIDLNVDGRQNTDQVRYIQADLTDYSLIESLVSNIIEQTGRIDVVINNAGITHMSCVADTDFGLLEKLIAVNYLSAAKLTMSCLPYLRKTTGHIVAVSSVAGFAPLYGRAGYSASKHAMEGFFGSLASEEHQFGVTVSLICPSFVNTRPELTAAVNGGVSSPGAAKKSTNGETITPESAASQIIAAITARKPRLLLGKVAKVAYWLFHLWPSRYMAIMTKGGKKEFE